MSRREVLDPQGALRWSSSCPISICTSLVLGSEPNLLVRACNQLGQFLQHRETNLRYLALESMCTLASSEFSHEAVKTHIDTVINALKVRPPAPLRVARCLVALQWAQCSLDPSLILLFSDGAGCQREAEGGRPPICHV